MSQQNFGPPEPSAYPNLQAGQQPPQYQAPPPVGFAPPSLPVAPTVIVGAVPMSQDPQQMNCPACHSNVITETSPTPGLLTYLLSGVLCLFGCWLGCCLIPCCVADCQDTEHRCPNCKHFFGTHRKM